MCDALGAVPQHNWSTLSPAPTLCRWLTPPDSRARTAVAREDIQAADMLGVYVGRYHRAISFDASLSEDQKEEQVSRRLLLYIAGHAKARGRWLERWQHIRQVAAPSACNVPASSAGVQF